MDTITAQILLTDENPSGNLTINDIKIAAHISHICIFALLMDPLYYIYTKANNTVA